MATTSVPFPEFGDKGFVAPDEAEILAGRQTDINDAFGGDLNMSPATPQGQLAASDAAIIGYVNDMFLRMQNMVDPAFSSGRMQDAIGRIYFIERIPSQPTVLQVACVGANGVTIPVGATIIDTTGALYSCATAGTIGGSGTITLPFAAQLPGPTPVPSSIAVSIYQSISGWDTATVAGGVVGRNTETRAEFERRRSLSVAKNSMGQLAAVRGAVLALDDVIDCFVTENAENNSLALKGYTLVPNSIYVCVAGGIAADVAKAIWTKKAPGCAYNGDTTVTVEDSATGYIPPYPSYAVTFETADDLAIVFAISIVNSDSVPSDAEAQIATALAGAFAGSDGGDRAAIATDIYASRFYCAIAALGSWAKIVAIKIGATTSAAAQFTGSIAGTTLTVTAVASGAIAVGQTIKDAAGLILAGTKIASLGSGTGGVGTYNLDTTQDVASTTIFGMLADQDAISVLLNQIPTIDANDVTVSLV